MIDFEILHRSNSSHRTLPANLDWDDLGLFDHELTREIPKVNMLRFHDVYVHPSEVLSQGSRVLPISFTSPDHLNIKTKIKAFSGKLLFWKIKTNTLWITDNWSNGYSHWITLDY